MWDSSLPSLPAAVCLSLKLLKLGETDSAKVLAWKSSSVKFLTNFMSTDYTFSAEGFPDDKIYLDFAKHKNFLFEISISDGKGRNSTCWICTAFLLPWSSCQQRFSTDSQRFMTLPTRTESNSWGYKRDLFACYIGFVNFTPSTTQQSAGMWDICLIC